MRKITQRFIGFLMIFVVLVISVMFNTTLINAQTNQIDYTFDNGIPSRSVYCNGHTSELTVYVDGFYSNLQVDSNPIISAYCDQFGTFWFQSSNYGEGGFEIYWANYELEGFNMIPHYFNNGATHVAVGSIIDSYINTITCEQFPLPTFDDLKNYIENGVPIPGSKPKPITNTDPTPQVTPTIKKVTISGNTIKIINSNNEVIDKATFNKKKAVLSYKGKKVTKVKGAWFTEKGKVVYIKGSKANYKAYYFDGKKSTLIKAGVSSVSTKNKFATSLKLKNGKTYKLK